MRPRLLLVEDDPSVRRSLADTLSDEGFEVAEADGALAALQVVDDFEPEVVLSDIRMPEMDGIQLLQLLRQRTPSIDVVLMTAYDDMATVAQAMRAVEAEVRTYSLDALVGRDSRMIEVYKKVGQLAASRVNVLIRGETGTGKGMVARGIHYNSSGA